MAPRLSGFTRASSLGPIAEFMGQHGASIERVLSDVDLPMTLLEQPETLVPLREQFRLLERAARATGDEFFGARLGQVVRSRQLSGFGAWICGAPTLRDAIARAHAGLSTMLQTSTELTFAVQEGRVCWTIEFTDPESVGRHHNELLGVSYMIDTIRSYAGCAWRPDTLVTALPRGTPHAALEDIFRCNIGHGAAATSITFDACLLDSVKPSGSLPAIIAPSALEPTVPGQCDALAMIGAVTDLALHDGYPRIDWVAAKLGTTRRTLQRLLAQNGTSFSRIVDDALLRRAVRYLEDRERSITAIGFELGYRDAAHFSRAFHRWTGMAPRVYRQRLN
ncbi:Transcriptional regulator, AraC family [Hyphomicrobium sulfonivorans]|uniref:Transcriptional regulator, AraC family n=1 Tax=Hyphomicrobium sulfonivorans TaxID=121290 RepID=A0A109BPU8_HYPSL|nr:AraC family transcriptional regulator [Hyphomicrobium sulfonivorans]KWT71987.1 Transcriptional regulator, AraC family [Hyphomicrobium sulfonivorans]